MQVQRTTDNGFTISGLSLGSSYQVWIQVQDACELGKKSPKLPVPIQDCPTKMETVVTVEEGCGVRL